MTCGCNNIPYGNCQQPCCEPVRLPVACVNSNNVHNVVTHNYMPRPISCQPQQFGYYAAVAPVTYRSCNCAPQTNCSCNSTYGQSADYGCAGGVCGNSTTGNVPANASVAPYILASQLAPGKYMITAVDNVAHVDLFVGSVATAKTIGTEFIITVPTDIFMNVISVSALPTSIRLTKI
jgi:hypothetical protein